MPRKYPSIKTQVFEIKVVTCRVCESHRSESIGFESAESIVKLWREEVEKAAWFDAKKEAVVVFLLDTQRLCTEFNLVSLGSLQESLAHPREVFRPAIVAGAAAIILAHNHPSGDPNPSRTDMAMTRKLCDAGRLLSIPLEDHIIIGEPDPKAKLAQQRGYYSFREFGQI